jgi:hypothetical protein
MADYTQVTFFAPKDALPPGDPGKIALGVDVDGELTAIATAIASKYDSADLASQAEAEAGTDNTVLMTPLRVAQAAAVTSTPVARTLTAGTGLSGGGDLSADRSFAIDFTEYTAGFSVEDYTSAAEVLINVQGTPRRLAIQDMGVQPFADSATSRTFGLTDANRMLLCTAASAATYTVPAESTTDFRVGAVLLVHNTTTFDLTIDPAVGVTLTSFLAINSTANREIVAGGTAALIKVGADDWALSGDIA